MKDKRSPSQLEAVWKESDMAGGRKVDAMVMIMRTNGCCWVKEGGCTMCGYREASMHDVTEADLLSQLEQALSRYKGEPFVKIYTSGSFLDDNEVPPAVRERIFEAFSGCERILFESRPEFITEESLAHVPKTVTVALGLESSDPEVLRTAVHKGFTPADIERAGRLLKSKGLGVRTYLLLKPPFMTEAMAIEDAVRSARFADAFSDEISVNPLNVQRATYVERIWKRGEFRPPWIWSLIEVFRQLYRGVQAAVWHCERQAHVVPVGGRGLEGSPQLRRVRRARSRGDREVQLQPGSGGSAGRVRMQGPLGGVSEVRGDARDPRGPGPRTRKQFGTEGVRPVEYDIKKGWFKNIEGDLLEAMMKDVFGNVAREGDVLVSSYGVLDRIEVRVVSKTILDITTVNKDGCTTDDEAILDSKRRLNEFAEKATGFDAKARMKRAQKKAKEGKL